MAANRAANVERDMPTRRASDASDHARSGEPWTRRSASPICRSRIAVSRCRGFPFARPGANEVHEGDAEQVREQQIRPGSRRRASTCNSSSVDRSHAALAASRDAQHVGELRQDRMIASAVELERAAEQVCFRSAAAVADQRARPPVPPGQQLVERGRAAPPLVAQDMTAAVREHDEITGVERDLLLSGARITQEPRSTK